jgi:hypothetical protein
VFMDSIQSVSTADAGNMLRKRPQCKQIALQAPASPLSVTPCRQSLAEHCTVSKTCTSKCGRKKRMTNSDD